MTHAHFIHLRVHSEFSLLEGAVRLKAIPELCHVARMPAVALTDTNNMFAALEFSVTVANAGIQPIIGCQIDLVYDVDTVLKSETVPAPIVLLAQNEIGYQNLLKLNSCLYLNKSESSPRIRLAELGTHHEGLICLTGGPKGPVGQLLNCGRQSAAEQLIDSLEAIFTDRLYIELQRHHADDETLIEEERLAEKGSVEFAYDKNIPLVATNDVYFPTIEMYEAHDALLCIAEGSYVDQQDPRRRLTQQHYFKSAKEMSVLFSDLPEAIENTVEIARRCSFMARTREPILPKFAEDEVEELRSQARRGLVARLEVIPLSAKTEEYEERLEFELGIIERMGFCGYFLIVADFIKWAKEQGILVGPGRGSGAGSLVAYALTITNLDPLRYALLFERFLNPDRVSMPDFDIDFSMDRRDEVINYVRQKYGNDRVAQIVTFGALLSKAAVRDIGRVLQIPYRQTDRISKLIPTEANTPVPIDKALADEPRIGKMAEEEEVIDRLISYVREVEGLLRNPSIHAAGLVIGDRPLDEIVPLYKDPRSDLPVTQFNMKWVEQAGLVKFDFLGLKTLTAIQNIVDIVLASGRHLHERADGKMLYEPARGMIDDINGIPFDDEATFDLYASAQTVAVFQVESTGMMDALKRMKPSCIEDIIALVALYRPGPMENIPKFCEVKNGLSERETLHPLIDHILDETQGIIVYQEQVMQIAQEMAGYTLAEADLLRRAMGKKIQSAMDAEQPKFLNGAVKNGVLESTALHVWNLLQKFANYGFNKSHAAAYAVVSYQTAWLKANHPAEFIAGMMNCDIASANKLAAYLEEVKRNLALPWIPPCINRSDAMFSVVDGQLVFALSALRNVGSDAMRMLVDARGDHPFVNLFDFARRVDLKRVGKRSLEMLIRAGVFDQLDSNRFRVLESLDSLIAYSTDVFERSLSGQISLFGDSGEDLTEPRLSVAEDNTPSQKLADEFAAIGFYLSGHPVDEFMPSLRLSNKLKKDYQPPFRTFDEVVNLGIDKPIHSRMVGVVSGYQIRKSARGNQFAFCQLSDPTGAYEVTIFSEVLERSRPFLEVGSIVVLVVEVSSDADQLKFLCRSIIPLEKAVADVPAAGLRVYVHDEEALPQIANILDERRYKDGCVAKGAVSLCLMAPDLPGEVELDVGSKVPVNSDIRKALKSLRGVMEVEDM